MVTCLAINIPINNGVYALVANMRAVLLSIAALSTAALTEWGQHAMRDDWTKAALGLSEQAAFANTKHTVVFCIAQKNMDLLTKTLTATSDPSSPRYGQHLTSDEVHALTANPTATAAVVAFLRAEQIAVNNPFPSGEYLHATAPVATWSRIFATNFTRYMRADGGSVVRAPHYTIPSALSAHVWRVFQTIQLPIRVAPTLEYVVLSKPGEKTNVTDLTNKMDLLNLFNYYDISTTIKVPSSKGATNAVFSQKPYTVALTDISTFAVSMSITPQTITCMPGADCKGDSECQGYDPDFNPLGFLCVEANLDTQWITAVPATAATATSAPQLCFLRCYDLRYY
jgi:hypothetical protein